MSEIEPHLILASQSPRRVRLLREAGYRVEVHPSRADELDAQHHDIHEIVVENARRKGREVIARLSDQFTDAGPEVILVAADTLVAMGQKVYSKPRDLDQAEQFHHELSGKRHQVYTGVYLYQFATGRELPFYDVTQVVLKVRPAAEIRALFTRVNPLDKAGGYGYQDSEEIVERLEGSETNVIGLPMERLAASLNQLMRAQT